MNARLMHFRQMGCELNVYRDDDGWRIELSSGRTGRDTNDEPSYWIVSADGCATREEAEQKVLDRFDELGFWPTPETTIGDDERVPSR